MEMSLYVSSKCHISSNIIGLYKVSHLTRSDYMGGTCAVTASLFVVDSRTFQFGFFVLFALNEF